MTVTPAPVSHAAAKEVVGKFKENYAKIRKLLDEDSKHDPETQPYLSKYKAKAILCNMRDSLKETQPCGADLDKDKLDAMLGVVLLNIGIIDMESEELSASEEVLTEAVQLLNPKSSKPEIIIPLINVYNHLGILWSNRDDPAQAKTYLIKAKQLYESFKCTLQMPLAIDHILSEEIEDIDEVMVLEKAHTLTLYYLAQVYGSLKENLKSAVYCHVTLRRQLQYSDFEPIDWALNSATLSQFFAEQNGFYQSRHHLAAASKILDDYKVKLDAAENDSEEHLAKVETFKLRSADIARCWAKYCIFLLTSSKNRLMGDTDGPTDTITDMSNLTLEDDENICDGNMLNLIFEDLDVSKYENQIGDKWLLTYQDARDVFLNCQIWINKAKEYYTLEKLASDYIELVQDHSQAYVYLAFFEEEQERRAKMHKRRIDMLEAVLREINPTYYVQYCRQLWFELAEIYSDLLNIKLEKLTETKQKATPHALKKINSLCENSILNYERFLLTVKDKNGKLPQKLETDLVRPVVSAYAFIGRNSMKRIAMDKATQLANVEKSYDSYQAVVDICSSDEEAAAIMGEEYSLCQEMAKILPIKIKRMKIDLNA